MKTLQIRIETHSKLASRKQVYEPKGTQKQETRMMSQPINRAMRQSEQAINRKELAV